MRCVKLKLVTITEYKIGRGSTKITKHLSRMQEKQIICVGVWVCLLLKCMEAAQYTAKKNLDKFENIH